MGHPENGSQNPENFELNVALLELLERAFPSANDTFLRANIASFLEPCDELGRFAMTVHPLEESK